MIVLVLTLVLVGASSLPLEPQDLQNECNLSNDVVNEIGGYQYVTDRIIQYVTKGPYKHETWNNLAKFVDKFGSRISGSQNLENAIDYMIDISNQNNLENIHTENVEVPHWVRGFESATLLKPRINNLPMLGLGYSVATPPEGITAKAIVVKSFEELKSLPYNEVAGKIVVYDQVFVTYGETVKYRSKGASEAARQGAVAALVRSVTPYSIASPHTGMQSYAANVTKIPVACITLEDADMLSRMQDRGEEIVIKIIMSATLDNKISRNTIVNLNGSTLPSKYVVVSGHIDSWDVGQGAMDDGAGAFISWAAPVLLKKLDLRAKRTLRAIFWTAEEVGLIGGKAYEKAHRNESDNYNFVMESDYGTFAPLGIRYSGSEEGKCIMKEILKLFKQINATELILDSEPGPDISYMTDRGIPGGGLHNDNSKYFWYHHSEGDTMNVIDPDVLDLCTAFWAAFSYIVADLSFSIPR